MTAALLLWQAPPPAFGAECFSWPIVSIHDGDTVRAIIEGRSTRIRLPDHDTPEIDGKCEAERMLARVARDRLRQLVAGAGAVTFCWSGEKDVYGRPLANLLVDGRDVGDILVAESLAKPWTGRREDWCR